ncbi:FMN-dependent NADH-azoreductase [Rhodothalassium salexigens]|uniref:FMN-dependent NADH-azoreductase n=1 Tax=Rhodothalassium salexigens TaxID=1086 RepID=UPI001913B50F|nr:NAD(P)H-dependent oxidoreductase [Rhodothalassium salexigens]MBK5910645.1 FMN-dependent NADH-azoreductase [Rhodothalassium salexigens]MBK5920580.1 FMN-dependent NADH-azoreductase [Rhodothalassium salexigens]
MPTLLRIDASARTNGSLTRALADTFINALQSNGADFELICRDVGQNPPPALTEHWLAAAFKSAIARTDRERAVLALSDKLIDEVAASDLIVMATPMYNYGMPSALKAWFDQVIRLDKTFSFDRARGDFPLEPILSGKALVLLTACGEFGFGPQGVRAGQGHLEPHVRTVSSYLGVERFDAITIEYQEFNDARHDRSKADAHHMARRLAQSIAVSLNATV